MAFISTKIIKGRKRYYLEESARMLDGRVKKTSIYLKAYAPRRKYGKLAEYRHLLKAKANAEMSKFASDYYKNSLAFNSATLCRLEQVKLEYRDITKKLSSRQIQDIIDRFTVNFTYESNAIEWNSLTLKDVNMVLHEKKAIKGKDLREIYETLNTREAMELIFKNRLSVTEKDIIRLHRILVKNTGVSFGYKKLPNFLIGRNIKTTPPEKVKEELKSLIEWYNSSKLLHPLQKAALFHGSFEKIHPFEDGNGRAGRLLINVMLLNNNYPPLIIRKTQRLAYFGALEAFDNNYKEKLERFLIEKYKHTHEKFFKVYIKYL